MMKKTLAGFLMLGIAAADAAALRIEGTSSFQPISAERVKPMVRAQRLEIQLPGRRPVTVAPWPGFLPQRFAAQTVSGERQMHPAGPIDRLSFTRPSEQAPWLTLASGARRSHQVIGNWRLALEDTRWSLDNGHTHIPLNRQPAKVKVGARSWCVYALDATLPHSSPGVANEAEAQLAWAALRLDRNQTRCPRQSVQ